MRICILLSTTVPAHQLETLRRNGLQVVRLGSDFRVRILGTLLGAEEATVRIDDEEPPPGEGPRCSAPEPEPGV
jgi:hypothetical protein